MDQHLLPGQSCQWLSLHGGEEKNTDLESDKPQCNPFSETYWVSDSGKLPASLSIHL